MMPLMRFVATKTPEQQSCLTIHRFLEECQHISTLQLAPQHDSASRVNTMNLEHRLRYIETDRRDRLHDLGSSESWGPQQHPLSMALTRRGRSRPQHHEPTLGRSARKPHIPRSQPE